MSEEPKKQGYFQEPRNVLMLVAGAVGVYFLLKGLYGIFFSQDAEEILDGKTPTVVSQALLSLPSPEGSAPKYDRQEFGDGWADLDANGCNTRNEVLARDLTEVTFKPGTDDCVVMTGVLDDPYTGQQIEFQRGEETSELVQIDHVVPLANAWAAGAWEWDVLKREEFANDPLNLLAVDGEANQNKMAMTADEWLPTDPQVACDYVVRQIAVKDKWELSVTDSERTAMAEVLVGCSNTELPE